MASHNFGGDGIPDPDSFRAKLKLVPTRSTSSDPTSLKLIPPKPSTSLLVSNSSKSAEGSPESKQTEAARLSNCWPAEMVVVTVVGFGPEAGDVDVEGDKSNMSSSLFVLLQLMNMWFGYFCNILTGNAATLF